MDSGEGARCFYILIALMLYAECGFSQVETVKNYSIADTNRYGSLTVYNFDGWEFSFQEPERIRSKKSLINSRPVSLMDFSTIKDSSEWDQYGWFELEVFADSSLAGIPWVLSYRNTEAARIWLNGVLILNAGSPSKNPENEVLSRFVNPPQVGVMLREGVNYFLIEYSSHTESRIFKNYGVFENGIFVVLYKQYEVYQRRHRAFVFGGTIMLLSLLVLIHFYLALKFRGQYHLYVCLTTLFLMVHAVATLSDTLIDWSYSYTLFYEYCNALAFILVVYFFLISVRKIFDLKVHWPLLTTILGISIIIGIYSIYFNRAILNILHPVLLLLFLSYGGYSLFEAKTKSSSVNIKIIAAGLVITITGALLYVLVYLALGYSSNTLFMASIILAYTGIPISLTFNVAANYASLIGTLEEKVRVRTSELEASNEYQKRFFANISHEFRTPLTITEGLIYKMMGKVGLNEIAINAELSMIKRNMNRLHDMVNQIIDLTKSEQNHLTLHQKYCRADNLAAISVESFRSLAEYRGHIFQFHPNAEGAVIYVDRNKVEVMINNLISNAIKFIPDGGSIEVKTTVDSGNFILTVQDSGPGIPVGKEEIIFERFHRLTRPETEYVEGMGVGLELSRTLARLHDGEIRALPGLKSGACFELKLPVAVFDSASVSPIMEELVEAVDVMISSNVASKELEESVFDILLVEDNEDMMEYVQDILSELGIIKKAKNGKEALQLLDRYTPDIIITDLMMPVMGGKELVETLAVHEKWNQIPVVVLTAKALEEDRIALLRIGVVDYITKPFLPEQLILKTKNLLTYYTRRKKLKLSIKSENMKTDSGFLTQATAFVAKNIGNSRLSVDMLANEFSQSRSSLYRNLQLETGMTPAEFIREIRLANARQLTDQKPGIRLEELANAVGYKSATSFRKVYEERFGEHPLG